MANTKVTGDLLADGTLFARHLNESHGITTSVIGEGTNLYYTNDRVSSYLSSNGYATSTAIIASIVDSAPSTLDTLNELAAALGDDPNFATTVTTAIATKVDGTGTANYLMKWSDSNTATNSVIYDDGTNIGLGVTPSTIWSTSYNALQIGAGGSLYAHSSAGNALKIGSNIVYEGTAPNYYDKYLNNSTATKYEQDSGTHSWHVASSGTSGNAVSWNEAMRIINSGNVGIGTTSPLQKLDVNGNISLGSWTKPGSTYVGLRRNDDGSFGVGGDSGLVIESYNHASPYAGDYSQRIHLRTHLYNGGSHNVLTAYGLNVGIGTTSPADTIGYGKALDIQSSTGAAVYLRDSDNPTTQYGFLAYDGNDNGLKLNNENSSGFIRFNTAGSERMRITSGGNIGIGTTSPGQALTLGANKNIRLDWGGGTDTTIEMHYDSSYRQGFNFQGNNRKLIIYNYRGDGNNTELTLHNGNVGVGTNTPTARVDTGGVRIGRDFSLAGRSTVRIDSLSTAYPADILFGHTGAANQTSWTGVYWSISSRAAADGDKLHFYRGGGNATSPSESIIMTIAPQARVGINNSAPEHTLHVNGTAQISEINFETGGYHGIRFQSGGTNKFKWGHDKDANQFYIYDYTKNGAIFTATGNGNISLTPTGNIGIGVTAPAERLDVAGTAQAYNFQCSNAGSYNVPEAFKINTDVNWTFGSYSDNDSQYWMQVKYYGTGNDSRGFRLFNVNGGSTTWRVNGAGTMYTVGDVIAYASDKRLKENIKPIPNAIEKVKSLSGVTFDWNEKSKEAGFIPSRQKDDVGVLAQEVQSVLPQAIDNAPFDWQDGKSKSGENYLTVKYEKIVPLLIEAIKEQQKQIDELKAIINGGTE